MALPDVLVVDLSIYHSKIKNMKKIFLATTALIAGSFFSANAGTIRENTGKEIRKEMRKERREKRRELWLHSVNSITATQFYDDFPNAMDVTWTRGEFAEASFYDGGILKTAYYDPDNTLVGTIQDVDYSLLPQKARHYIDRKYPGYSVQKMFLFDDNESNDTDVFLFGQRFDDRDSYFAVLSNGVKQTVLMVTPSGEVSFFRNYK